MPTEKSAITKNSAAQSGFCNLRVLVTSILCSIGLFHGTSPSDPPAYETVEILDRAVATERRLLANPFGVAVFREIAPTERGGYSLREMARQHGAFEYFNRLLRREGFAAANRRTRVSADMK